MKFRSYAFLKPGGADIPSRSPRISKGFGLEPFLTVGLLLGAEDRQECLSYLKLCKRHSKFFGH